MKFNLTVMDDGGYIHADDEVSAKNTAYF